MSKIVASQLCYTLILLIRDMISLQRSHFVRMNGLDIGIGQDTIRAKLRPNTALLHTTEMGLRGRPGSRVDPYRPRLNLVSNLLAFGEVGPEDRSAKTHRGVVCALEDLSEIGVWLAWYDGTEWLFD